jgi:hypothetical protein
MLNYHPKVAVPYESHIFNTFSPLLKSYGNLSHESNIDRLIKDILSTTAIKSWEPRISLTEIKRHIKRNSLGDIFNAIMVVWMRKTDKRLWAEKTPHNVFYYDTILNFFPNAKIIHIVRDGRDVALSFLKARFGPKSAYTAGLHWSRYLKQVQIMKSHIEIRNFHEVKYEALLAQPANVLTGICDFIGISYDSRMLNFYENKTKYMTDSRNLKNLNKPLMTSNAGKWVADMSPHDQKLFESVAGDCLVKHGYETFHDGVRLTEFQRTLHNTAGRIKKLFYMAKNFRGFKTSFIHTTIRLRLHTLHRFHQMK